MQDLLYKMVERMMRRSDSFSRNKNFEAFNDPRLGNATRIVRHLKALQADVLHFGASSTVLEPWAEPNGDAKWRLSIAMQELGGQRVAYLTPQELTLLCLDPHVAALLAPLHQGSEALTLS